MVDVLNWQGAGFATNSFNGFNNVVVAVDIQFADSQTGIVGAPGPLTPTPFSSVPGPIAGAGVPGLIAACAGLLALGRRRRRQQVA